MGRLCCLTRAAKDSPHAVSRKPHAVLPVKIVKHSTFFLFSRWASATLGHWTPVPVHKHLFQVHPSQVHPKREPHPQRTSLQECWSHVSVLQNFPDYLTRRKQIFLSRGCQCSVSGVSSRQKQLLRKQNSNIPCSCRQGAACCKLCAVLPISTL